jgi:carbamoyl-phosphate synthase large subunit
MASKALAQELSVIGLMNIQYAVKDETLYVLEVNPRASRTAPFVSKAVGVPLPKLAAKIMVGHKLKDLGFTEEMIPAHYSVKEAVFPFAKFPGIDITLGPEMRSTGEVMGIDEDHDMAYAKAQMAAGSPLPLQGNVFISVRDRHKDRIAEIAAEYHALGFQIYATNGTHRVLEAAGIPAQKLPKVQEGRRPNVLDMIKNGEIQLVINTPDERQPSADEVKIRSSAIAGRITIITTLRAARASAHAIAKLQQNKLMVKPLQDYHKV